MMKRRSANRSKSRSKSKEKGGGESCRACLSKYRKPKGVAIRQALYRKYSGCQNHYYLSISQQLTNTQTPTPANIHYSNLLNYIQTEQHLKSYQQLNGIYFRLEQAIKLFEYHKELPRMFMEGAEEIVKGRHHSHRLLEYFRLAKLLGLTVQEESFSTFVQSVNNNQRKASFDKLVGQISSYNFSNHSGDSENPQKATIKQMQDLLHHYGFHQKENEIVNRPYETPKSKLKARRTERSERNFH